jgi:dipeptidyl aminopeptidase/acylaminoacyl peptidase
MHHRPIAKLCLAFALVALFSAHPAAPAPLAAQQTTPVSVDDYGKWESLGASALSPDGRWLASQVRRVDGTYELRIYAVAATAAGQEDAASTILESGGSPSFSGDSRWLAYSIGYSEAEREAMQKEEVPIHDKMGLIDLTGAELEPDVVDGVSSFEFSDDAAFLAMHRYAPEESEVESADLVVRDLAAGTDINFGNIAQTAWQDGGGLLAMSVAAEGRNGNGVHLYDPSTGLLRALASGDADFRQLTWRKDAADLAVLRSVEDEDFEEPTHQVLVWRNLATIAVGATVETLVFDPASRSDFPRAMRVVDSRAPAWSDDGSKLFFGIREWEARPVADEMPEGGSGAGADEEEAAEVEPEQPEVEPADVDVWHTQDERLIPMQRLQKQRDLARNYLSVWHIDAGRFVQLGSDLMETATVLEDDQHATETDRKPYSFDNMFDRTRNDVYLIDVSTGERERVIEGTWYYRGGSATGRYLTYFAGDHYWVYDITTGRRANITAAVPTSFVDMEYDTPVREQRPPYGVAGWSQSDEALLLYDRYDIWGVHPDGSAAVNFTKGADEEIRHRYVRLDPDEEFIDLGKPVFMSLYGQWTKKYGYARMDHGEAPERLVFIDKNVGRLAKAEDAEIYSYIVQGFDDSPDTFVGGPDLAAHQVGATNPFQSDYEWGRSELVDYENSRGQRLQGALFYPAGYEPGKKYPLIVYVYELLSQTVHSYTAPSERSPYNTSVFNAHGYFVLRPDIVYVDREPGISAADCVEAAVEATLDTGMIDPERVGLVGHSWGGYEATFIPTQTDIFATSIAGAAITNFFSFYGALHWNIGMAETQHFETGQARMDVPYWEDMEAYARNSSVIHIMDLETPMLLFHGDNDGTVDFRQGVELYNYARRAGKFLVMLVYADEGHSARQKKNQVDYHHRILDWFGHFLKGEPAPAWISDGVSVIDRDKELERLKKD